MFMPASGINLGVTTCLPHRFAAVPGRTPNRKGQRAHWVECVPSQEHHATSLNEPEQSRQFVWIILMGDSPIISSPVFSSGSLVAFQRRQGHRTPEKAIED